MRLLSKSFRFAVAVVALTVACGVAAAKDVYIAQNAAGIADGSSCASARPYTFFNTSGNWGTGTTQIGPGTIVHLCGTISTALIARGNGASGQPVTVLFEPGAKISLGACGSTGCLNISERSYIIVDGDSNGLIEATTNGTGRGTTQSIGIQARNSNYLEVKNLTIRNMYVRLSTTDQPPNDYHGIWYNGTYSNFHHLTIHDVTCAICVEATTTDSNYYNNTIHDINWGIFISGGQVVNGNLRQNIYNNEIYDFTKWDDTLSNNYHHDGIFVAGSNYQGNTIAYVDVYNNYLHGTISECCTTAYIYTNDHNHVRVFNNLVVAPTGYYVNNGLITVGPGAPDVDNSVFNNTVVGGTTVGSGGACYNLRDQTRFYFENNLSSNCTYLIWTTSGNMTYTALNNNVYQSSRLEWRIGNTSYTTLATWRTASGRDANGRAITGTLNLDGNYRPLSNSIAIGAGANLSGLGISALNSDKDGRARPATGAWDAGAYQVAPNPPSGLTAIPK